VPPSSIAAPLLAWYDAHQRVLPWRARPANSYHVLLSEFMLQQTTVATVLNYFPRFIERFPDVNALAASPLEDVLSLWAGLGYYARARNLHKAAVAVVEHHHGRIPNTEALLRQLPGVGAYTAAAIAAIAFDEAATVVDSNVERVMARLHNIDTPLPTAKKQLTQLAATHTPQRRPGCYAQALMDLGSRVCVSGVPRCGVCPIITSCAAQALGTAATLPRKKPKTLRPTRHGTAFVLFRAHDDAVWLRPRPASGMLGGMLEVPGTPWLEHDTADMAPAAYMPMAIPFTPLNKPVEHIFSHFRAVITVSTARTDEIPPDAGAWYALDTVPTLALPTVMKKILKRSIAL